MAANLGMPLPYLENAGRRRRQIVNVLSQCAHDGTRSGTLVATRPNRTNHAPFSIMSTALLVTCHSHGPPCLFRPWHRPPLLCFYALPARDHLPS